MNECHLNVISRNSYGVTIQFNIPWSTVTAFDILTCSNIALTATHPLAACLVKYYKSTRRSVQENKLTLSTAGKVFIRRHIEMFLVFTRKQDLTSYAKRRQFAWNVKSRRKKMTFRANCQWRQFAWNVKSCFLGKIRKISSICRLLN